MQKTIFTILTDAATRDADTIQDDLDKEFAVGAPWFDRIAIDPAN